MFRSPEPAVLDALVDGVDAVVPAPGLPEDHPLFAAAAAAGRPVLSEFDLACAWDDRPVLAITGTNGKTTVTTLVADMLDAFGRAAPRRWATWRCPSSPPSTTPARRCSWWRRRRSAWPTAAGSRPGSATWLNFAEDHLDVHRTLADYRRAKARICADQVAGDTAVLNAEDPVVAAEADALDLAGRPAVVRFGLSPTVRRPPLRLPPGR